MLLRPWSLVQVAISRSRRQVRRIASGAAKGECVFAAWPKRTFVLVRSRGLWQELLEVFEQVGRGLEKASDLCVDVLNGL